MPRTSRTALTPGMESRSAPPPASYLARAFGTFDADPRFAWTARRRNRLLLVVAQAGFLVAAATLLSTGRPLLALGAMLTFFPLMSLINIGIHGLLDVPVDHLDEIMVRVRNEAKARAHTIVVVLLGAVFVLIPFGAGVPTARVADAAATTVAPSILAGALFFIAMLLPTWILAWRLPDAVPDPDTVGSDGTTEPSATHEQSRSGRGRRNGHDV